MAREPRQSIKPCAQDVTEHAMDIYKGSLAMGKLRGQTRSSSQVFKKPYQSIKLCARQKASNRHNYEWHMKTIYHQINYKGSLKGKLERANSKTSNHTRLSTIMLKSRVRVSKYVATKKHISRHNYIWQKKACHQQIQRSSHNGKL